jgi:hypothetical protein
MTRLVTVPARVFLILDDYIFGSFLVAGSVFVHSFSHQKFDASSNFPLSLLKFTIEGISRFAMPKIA